MHDMEDRRLGGDDDLSEIDVTEDEIDAMMAEAEPVEVIVWPFGIVASAAAPTFSGTATIIDKWAGVVGVPATVSGVTTTQVPAAVS